MMMMFGWVIMPILCVILIATYIYHKVKTAVFYFTINQTEKKKKIIARALSAIIILPALWIYGIWFIVLLHITVFLLLIDGIVWIIKRIYKEDINFPILKKIYKSGIIAILLAAIVCGYGRYNIFQVIRTTYTVETKKNIRKDGYKIVMLSDLHYGVSMDDTDLKKVTKRINRENADIVVLDGDIVDENTTLKQMKSAFRILGSIKSTYGIYYIYGNHDKNNYANKPNYTKKYLSDTIEKSGIKILEDQVIEINKEITLIGRADKSDTNGKREDISKLVKDLDKKKEWIVLDHQPTEYKKVKDAGADLILSGHTHAGQIWPAGLFASLFHTDELNYGKKQQGNLHEIVTSGIAGWGYPIRTEKHSEYIVVNVVAGSIE